MIFWDFVNLYSYYLLAAVVLRFLITLFPQSLTEGFNNSALGLRRKLVSLVERIFRTEDNFEVFVSSRILIPFFAFLFIDVGLTQMNKFITIMTLRVFVIVFHVFIIINVIPTAEDLIPLADATNNTKFIFISKVVILSSIAFTFQINGPLWFILLPISPILGKIASGFNLEKEYPSKF